MMKRFDFPRHLQRIASNQDPIANLFHLPLQEMTSAYFHEFRAAALKSRRDIAQLGAM